MSEVLGPAMQAMAQRASALLAWLCVELNERSRSLGVRRVLFMTREGVLFKAFYERFFEGGGAAASAELLQVSRMSTFAASLHLQGAAGLQRFFSQYEHAGWPQLLKSLGHVAPPAGSRPDVTGPALGSAIANTPALAAWLVDVSRRRHQELSAYLHQQHAQALAQRDVLVVDIGWRGTIQDNLAWALPDRVWHGVYLGLYPYFNPQPANATKRGLLFDPSRPQQFVGAHLLPLEYLFQPRQGSVIGYCDGQPVLSESMAADAFTQAFHQAVLNNAPWRARQFQDHGAARHGAVWLEESRAFWAGCQQMPLELFLALRRHAHDDTFGAGRVLDISVAAAPWAVLRGLTSQAQREFFLHFITSLPLELRRHAEVGWWLRGWLYARSLRRWCQARLEQRRG